MTTLLTDPDTAASPPQGPSPTQPIGYRIIPGASRGPAPGEVDDLCAGAEEGPTLLLAHVSGYAVLACFWSLVYVGYEGYQAFLVL
jgi:hypothetical protein